MQGEDVKPEVRTEYQVLLADTLRPIESKYFFDILLKLCLHHLSRYT